MKKTGKSLAAASLAVVLAVSALTACGSRNAAESTPAAGAEANGGGEKVLKVAMECSYAPYNWTQPGHRAMIRTEPFRFQVLLIMHTAMTL